MGRSRRELRVEAEDALIKGRVFAVMAARDWELLHEIAAYVQEDVDPGMARTDPSRYRLLRDGVTNCHIKGLSNMTPDRIREVTGWVRGADERWTSLQDDAPKP